MTNKTKAKTKQDNDEQNNLAAAGLLSLGLAGFGIWYWLRHKKATAEPVTTRIARPISKPMPARGPVRKLSQTSAGNSSPWLKFNERNKLPSFVF